MRSTPVLLAFGLLCAFASSAAAAQTPPSPSPSPAPDAPAYPCTSLLAIVTRPTVTTSVCTVPRGKVLIETGYSNTTLTGSNAGNSVTYPQTLVRVGSGDSKFEYDFTPPSIALTNTGGAIVRGATDAGAGVKYVLGYSKTASWGLNGFASVPSGSPAFTAGYAQYGANFNWTYTVNPVVGLAGTLGLNSLSGSNATGAPQRFFAFVPSLELTASFAADTEFFAEYSFFSKAGPSEGGRSLVDFGISREIGPHVQIDVEGGVQPTTIGGQRSHYVGAGISVMN